MNRLRSVKVAIVAIFLPALAAAQTPSQSTATVNTEQEQRLRQQQEAREREQALQAPTVRAQQAEPVEFPELPTETPCFRIERFALEASPDLPEATRTHGASALPQDPFAFARAWLDRQGARMLFASAELRRDGEQTPLATATAVMAMTRR